MSLFIETIKLENGKYGLIDYHNARMNRTILNFFGLSRNLNLEHILPPAYRAGEGTHKCRVVYGRDVEKIEIVPYVRREIDRLKIVSAEIDYSFKSADRSCFAKVLSGLGNHSDVLIIKNGFVTDTSYANVIFFDGKEWLTPSTYLLDGVKRRRLLDSNKIRETEITVDTIKNFKEVSLINAMLEPGDTVIDIKNINI